MEGHITKILTALTVMVVIAYIVSSFVSRTGKSDAETRTGRMQQRARGDVWQTPVALAPMADDALLNYGW